MARQRIRIRLKSFDHKALDGSAVQIVETATALIVSRDAATMLREALQLLGARRA